MTADETNGLADCQIRNMMMGNFTTSYSTGTV